MENKAWSVNGAIAVQTEAHDRLERAIAEKRSFGIYIGKARITTAASFASAKMYVGRDKRYTILPD